MAQNSRYRSQTQNGRIKDRLEKWIHIQSKNRRSEDDGDGDGEVTGAGVPA